MIKKKYTVVYMDGTMVMYCYVKTAVGHASFSKALKKKQIDVMQVCFAFTGHVEPADGWYGPTKEDHSK